MITEIKGTTYSVSHYSEYAKNGDNNLFEEVIDQMMLDGLNPILQEKIKNLPLKDKRLNILAFLDKDRNLFMKIKFHPWLIMPLLFLGISISCQKNSTTFGENKREER